MKKGFTLIELLAVIIILAIIALIATPIILNVVDDVKKSTAETEARMVVKGVNQYCELANFKATQDATYTNPCADKEFSEADIKIMVHNGNYASASVTYDGTKVTRATIVSNGYIVTYENDSYTLTKGTISESNPKPTPITYKCERATTLHTEICNRTSSGCIDAGYAVGATMTYGNLGTDGVLASGDAFDCDVNGDGTYDPATERFYYVSDLYNTTTKEFDNDYAVLIYYNNTTAGVADNTTSSLIEYDSSNTNYNGPRTAILNLPTTEQWNNVSLSSSTRAILNQNNGDTADGGTLPANFDYFNYASRLITVQEVSSACKVADVMHIPLNDCLFFLENTKFSVDLMGAYGHWLETPYETGEIHYRAWQFDYRGSTQHTSANSNTSMGVRPAIEVLKTDIQY